MNQSQPALNGMSTPSDDVAQLSLDEKVDRAIKLLKDNEPGRVTTP